MNEEEKSFIRDFVKIWITTHPKEVTELIQEVESLRLAQNNVFASSKSNDLRHLGQIPTDLMIKLKRAFPVLFRDNNLRWLVKEFPIFKVPEKI